MLKWLLNNKEWLFSGAGIVLLGFLFRFITRYLKKRKLATISAKLDFIFFHRPPFCHITQMRGAGVDFPVYYFRFKIINIGKIQADQCEVVVENIWKEDETKTFKEFIGFSPVWLKWSGIQNTRYISIQPDRKVFCDMGRIHHPDHEPESVYRNITAGEREQNKFFFEWPERFYSQWDCLLSGKYRIKIAVYSKNAKKISKKFNIVWSGIWKDQESEMLNELVIS